MNICILHGRLARDPDVRTTQSGRQVAHFTVAVDRPKTKDGQQSADFIQCVAWEKTAEMIDRYFHKGKEIALEGRVSTRSYDGQDGAKKYVTEITVSRVEFCGKKDDGGSAAGEPQGEYAREEDIPF